MCRPKLISLLIICMLFVACSSDQEQSKIDTSLSATRTIGIGTSSLLPKLSSTSTQATVTESPTQKPSFTVTQSPILTSPIKTNTVPKPTLTRIVTPTPMYFTGSCITAAQTLPLKIDEGILVLKSSDQITLMDFNKDTQNVILEKGSSFTATSPDGKWLAYGFYPDIGEPQIVTESVDMQKRTEITIGMGWLDLIYGAWLDNEHIWFPVWSSQGTIASTVVLDPFTGMQQEISSDYPGLKRFQFGPSTGAGLHFDYSSVVYDPSLEYVVYPETYIDGNYITLWSRKTQQVVARLLDGSDYGHLPIWYQDGSHVLMVARPQADHPKEWFIVSLDGSVRQLTHFRDSFSNFYIQNNASLSPDGSYLAFGLSLGLQDGGWWDAGQLVILDLKSLQVTYTCIPLHTRNKPVWSLDNRFIVFSEPGSIHPTPVVLLDVEKLWAAQIAVNQEPVGWMTSP